MAQVLVGNAGATLLVPIVTDPTEGLVTATCPICGEVDASYNFEDTVHAAEIHIDQRHE